MARGTHSGRTWDMASGFGFTPRPDHQARHYANADSGAGFTYGDPGQSGVRDLSVSPPSDYFFIPFSIFTKLENGPGQLALLDTAVCAYRAGEEPTPVPEELAHVATFGIVPAS